MMIKTESISYCCMPLNRCSTQRKDPNWITRQLEKQSTRITPLWRNRNLVEHGTINGSPKAIFIQAADHRVLIADQLELVYLGAYQDAHHFAVEIDPEDETLARQVADKHEFVDLRAIGPIMHPNQAAISAYARGLLYWHRHNQYCGRCGQATLSCYGGHMRQCLNPQCQKEHYPRTDPAVIMLVETTLGADRTPACLLGRHGKLPERIYSTLAGYVDPGENLEEAVAREVMEEAGITLDSIQYLGSQPWPFPSALMVGFIASTAHQQLTVDPEELDDARWFSRDQVLSFGEIDDQNAQFVLPRKDSIARNLIDAWLEKTG
jgi:NAD+ diphosphatase